MKMTKRMKILILILVVVAFTGVFTNINIIVAKESPPKVIIIPEIKEQVPNSIIDWVYKNSRLPRNIAKEIVIFVYANCKHPKLILGLIDEESNFNIFSKRNDTEVYGLGQIKYNTWKDEIKKFDVNEIRDLYDWKKNILVMEYIINKYHKQTKDLEKALSKYVGEIKKDMKTYRNNVLMNIGRLTIIENS
jgi:hypothetical protein